MRRLPLRIRELPALKKLFLHENPALVLPVEVLGPHGSTAILDYYFHIHPSEREEIVAGQVLRELKIIPVGCGEVGKTSLVDVLSSP